MYPVGTGPARRRAYPLHASYGWRFSLELSLVAVGPSRSRSRRSRVVAIARRIAHPFRAILVAGNHHLRFLARDLPLDPAELRGPEIQPCPGTHRPVTARSATPLPQHLSSAGTRISGREPSRTVRNHGPSRQHLDVGGHSFHQRLQPDPPRWGRA